MTIPRTARAGLQIEDAGAILTLTGKTGWREVEIGRGSSDATCPVHALEQYLHYAKIDFGPLFQRISRNDRKATGDRQSDKHVARLIKKTVLDAGMRVSVLLCMTDLAHASKLKEHDDNDDFQGTTGRAA